MLLVFQVNCPGCFSYALPFFNQLNKEFNNQGISFLALSTAFEDFNKNTLENTKALVEKGTLIGETQKMMLQQGEYHLPYSIDFPIGMDLLKDNLDDAELKKAANDICMTNANYNSWSNTDKQTILKRVEIYLKSLDKIALTFTLNQLKGTPSLLLFNNKYDVLKEWFGHVPYEQIASELTNFINKKP